METKYLWLTAPYTKLFPEKFKGKSPRLEFNTWMLLNLQLLNVDGALVPPPPVLNTLYFL